MNKLLEILHEIAPDVDFEHEDDLIGKEILDSMSIVMLVADLEDTFDIKITPVDILPENFNSAEAILTMVTRLQADK